jgi:hypothetical protein
MKAIVTNRPEDKDGVITVYPETIKDVIDLENFMADGAFVNLEVKKFISKNNQVIYYDIYYGRGQERKAK